MKLRLVTNDDNGNSVENIARAIVTSFGTERALLVADAIRRIALPFGKAVRKQ